MSEKEKGLRGELYNPNKDAALQQEMMKCKELCMQYNALSPLEDAKRQVLLTRILGGMGQGASVMSPFYCDYGVNITVGDGFFSNHNLVILDGASVSFGDNVFIGPNCCFSAAGHPLDAQRRNAGLEFAYPITVGDSVWFGANVTVLPGVSIGDGTVVGAGSVVTKDLPAGVVAAGNPARVLREITEQDAKNIAKRVHHKNVSSAL